MVLKERIPDDLYTTLPTGPAYGDMISAEDRRRADERALGEMASSETLAALNDKFLAADEPMPAIGIRLNTKLGTKEFAQTYIAYGHTEPGQGLLPTREVNYSGHRAGYKAKPGLALPVDPSSRGSVAYWPSYNWSEAEGSRVVGWWQHLQQNKFTAYRSEQEPEITDHSNAEIEFDSRPFTVWPTGFGRFSEGAPAVIDSSSEARIAIRGAIIAVREADARGDGVCTRRQGDVWQHAIFVGKQAVGTALEVLAGQTPGGADLPQPLSEMLAAVADELNVPA
jgi:hypothetical protein